MTRTFRDAHTAMQKIFIFVGIVEQWFAGMVKNKLLARLAETLALLKEWKALT